jgi:hypothetical protein
MSDKQDLRRENRFYREQCRGRVNKSPLPAAIAKTLHIIFDHMGSASDYTLAWVSHAALAEIQGLSERTIEWHCKAIQESGLLLVEKLGLREARQHLKCKFGYTLKGIFAHRLTFYRINAEHPFWAGDDGVVMTIKEVLAKRGGGRAAMVRRKTVNPVVHDGSNPVVHDALDPVVHVGQPLLYMHPVMLSESGL